jgi:S-adenosylmethionine:tRNA ribosyltransferase-isomerase
VERDRQLTAYDYSLPEDRIAQVPVTPRDSARMLVVDQSTQVHAIFQDLLNWLHPNDLLVLNNTRVLPARLHGFKASGLPVEVLLLEPLPVATEITQDLSSRWLALVKPGRRLKPGAQIWFEDPSTHTPSTHSEAYTPSAHTPSAHSEVHDPSTHSEPHSQPESARVSAQVLATDAATSGRILEFTSLGGLSMRDWLYQVGQVPLPPYITDHSSEPERYQTVYADRPGAVAAPTAGLHFTPELLARLQDHGIQQAFVTLHVGVGTFRPVEAETITAHHMHSESAEVPLETIEKIRQTKAKGGRVIAVGTTVVRALEGAAQQSGLQPFYGKTDLFIYPGYEWQVVDGLITNFHLPKSSLLMLVSALIGRERLLHLYELAIAEHYRFYSFGDAMFILPEAKHR